MAGSGPQRCCMNCRGSLDGVTGNRCPQCGQPFDPADAATFLPASPSPDSPWRQVARIAVTIFVVWHLLFLFITNAGIKGTWVASVIKPYEKRLGLDQYWGMFSSPLWTKCPFPAVRVHFTDGSSVDILSPNEPKDVTSFFRFGGARQRKYEHHLIEGSLIGTQEEPALRRLTEEYLRRWRAENPGDARVADRVTLLQRTYMLPPIGEKLKADAQPVVKEMGTFSLEESR